MVCKKGTHEKCMCLKRKHDGCSDCEKSAIEILHKYKIDLNEIIRNVKETGQEICELYIGVDGFTGDPLEFSWRSAIDILRGVCSYCKHGNSHTCDECMWLNEGSGEDYWLFDEIVLWEGV